MPETRILKLHESQIQYLEKRFNMDRYRMSRLLWWRGKIILARVPDHIVSDDLIVDITMN